MPLLVSVMDLQVGMRLSEAFIWRGRIMLPGDKVLGIDEIDILRRKYPDQCMKVRDPVLDSLADFEDDSKERQVATTSTQRITQCMTDFQQRIGHQTDLGRLNFTAIRSTTASVIDYLKNNPVSAALLDRNAQHGSYLALHAGNVFYLSMVLGAAVRDYVIKERQRQTAASNLSYAIAMDLLPLGLGAMFMDVGMTALEYLFEPGYLLTDEDRKKIRQHPQAGADMLPDDLPAGVKTMVRMHHENYDGTGYPAGLKGANLHVFTRILRICDAFDAGTCTKAYAHAKSTSRVLWEMCAGPHQHCYDPVLTKVFMSIIQPFPIGARLQLTDGRQAVVVKYNRKQPFCPTAIIAFDESGARLEPGKMRGPLNIGEENELRLAAYAGEDLSYIYGSPLVAAASADTDVLALAYP
jgi:HD-GYP domain-containing protein (c-di-GMP phosphodiesterase class II)